MSGDSEFALPGATRVSRVCLRVGSIDRVAPYYRDAVGLTVRREDQMATLSAGDTPLLVLEEDAYAQERPADAAGLFHLAVRVPDRGALADALGRLRAHSRLSGASDHLVSEALYSRDPEGNGVEVYCDRPREEWTEGNDGDVVMETLPLDLEGLSTAATGNDRLQDGTDIGHVHLEVTDLSRSVAFYAEDLGLQLRARYGGAAAFLAAGKYHHHVGLNVWNRRSTSVGESRGLAWCEFVLPDQRTLHGIRRHLDDRGVGVEGDGRELRLHDPDGISLRLRV